jgi:hypothetical protein
VSKSKPSLLNCCTFGIWVCIILVMESCPVRGGHLAVPLLSVICTYICTLTQTDVHTLTLARAHTHTCMHTHAHRHTFSTQTHTLGHTHTFTHKHSHTHIFSYAHTHMCTHSCLCTHTLTHRFTHLSTTNVSGREVVQNISGCGNNKIESKSNLNK